MVVGTECWALLVDWSGIGDFLTGLGAVGAAGAAAFGLSTWRKELSFRRNTVLAESILLAAFGVEKALNEMRNPFVEPWETALGEPLDISFFSGDIEYRSYLAYLPFEARIQKHASAFSQLDEFLPRARALLGVEVSTAMLHLGNAVGEIRTSISSARFSRSAYEEIVTGETPTSELLEKAQRHAQHQREADAVIQHFGSDDFGKDVWKRVQLLQRLLTKYIG